MTIVGWRQVFLVARDGGRYPFPMDTLIEDQTLLTRIKKMPSKQAITFTEALQIRETEFMRLVFEVKDHEQVNAFSEMDWVQWISGKGYHIQLSGDEYQLIELSADAA